MPGDFFAEDVNALLFGIVLSGLCFMMTGCFAYHKWQHIKSKTKDQYFVPQKTKSKLRQFLKRNKDGSSELSKERALDEIQMQEQADAMEKAENDRPAEISFNSDERQTATTESGNNSGEKYACENAAVIVLNTQEALESFTSPEDSYVPDITEL